MSLSTGNDNVSFLGSQATKSHYKKSSRASMIVSVKSVIESESQIKLSNFGSSSGVNDSERKSEVESIDVEDVGVVDHEEEAEHEVLYEPPPFNFIKVQFGDAPAILVNHDCKKKTLVDYINSKLSSPIPISVFDMCDTEGHLVGLRFEDTHTNVRSLFVAPEVHVPCLLLLDDQSEIAGVEPRLENWRAKYPKMEGRINSQLIHEKGKNPVRDDDSTTWLSSRGSLTSPSALKQKEMPKVTVKKPKK